MPNRLPLIFTPSLGIPHGTLLGLAAAVGQARGRAHLKLMDFFFVSHDWSAGQSNAPWHRYQKKWPALWSGPYDENNWFPFVFGQLLNPYFWGADLPGVNLASRKITADTDIEPDSPKWWFSKKNRYSHRVSMHLHSNCRRSKLFRLPYSSIKLRIPQTKSRSSHKLQAWMEKSAWSSTGVMVLAKRKIFHQPRFPWNKRISLK